jgi:hypothetical protein
MIPRTSTVSRSSSPRHPLTLVKGGPGSAPLPRTLRNLLLFPFQPRRSDSHSGEEHLGEALATWMQANCWNHEQLSELTRSCSEGRLSVSSKELENITRQKAVNPRPHLFRALAAIHKAVISTEADGPGASQAAFVVGDLVRYATPLTADAAANKPSWWFAIYCSEAWAAERISLHDIRPGRFDLSSRLSQHLREQIVQSGQDPVRAGKAWIRDLLGDSQAQANLLNLWLMGLRDLGPDEVHAVIHPVLHILRSHGSTVVSIRELLDTLYAHD